jgi:hypothetical protein
VEHLARHYRVGECSRKDLQVGVTQTLPDTAKRVGVKFGGQIINEPDAGEARPSPKALRRKLKCTYEDL